MDCGHLSSSEEAHTAAASTIWLGLSSRPFRFFQAHPSSDGRATCARCNPGGSDLMLCTELPSHVALMPGKRIGKATAADLAAQVDKRAQASIALHHSWLNEKDKAPVNPDRQRRTIIPSRRTVATAKYPRKSRRVAERVSRDARPRWSHATAQKRKRPGKHRPTSF